MRALNSSLIIPWLDDNSKMLELGLRRCSNRSRRSFLFAVSDVAGVEQGIVKHVGSSGMSDGWRRGAGNMMRGTVQYLDGHVTNVSD